MISFKTNQVDALKTLFQLINEFVPEVAIVFTKQGILIKSVTNMRDALIHVKLNSESFDNYVCDPDKLVIGIDLENLLFYLNMLHSDSLVFRVSSDKLIINDSSDTESTEISTEIEIGLLDIPELKFKFPPSMDFNAMISIPGDRFNKMCKARNPDSKRIQITARNDTAEFCIIDDSERITIKYAIKNTILASNAVRGLYEFDRFATISKYAHRLSSTIEIYQKSDFPAAIKFNVGTLGRIVIYITPILDGKKSIELVYKPTTHECLIMHIPIQTGDQYYVCSNKEEHVYDKNALDQWGKYKCLLCDVSVQETVFTNGTKETVNTAPQTNQLSPFSEEDF